MRRTRRSFKATLNQAVRSGLAAGSGPAAEEPFRVTAQPLGLRPGIDPARLNQLADDADVEAFAETALRVLRRGGKRP
jgi:hypothetical protein